MIRATAIAAILLVLSGCTGEAETSVRAGVGYQVDKLFTVDGCTVYRFHDGRYRYFTNCSGSTSWSESCGKNCTNDTGVDGGRP